MVVCFVSPFELTSTIFIAGAYSARTCRHAPQGGQNSVVSVAITMVLNSDSPSDMALNTATLSAQIVRL